jgi:hypothetical protein
MDEQLRTRVTGYDDGTVRFFSSYGLSHLVRVINTLAPNCTVHEKFIDGLWLLHNEKGPAIIGIAYLGYYISGLYLTEQEWLGRTTKLGKVLYG